MTTLKTDKFEIQIERNYMPGRSNSYYDAKLIAGEWPINKDLIVMCDNGNLSGVDCTFGGTVNRTSDKTAFVTVYID